MYPTMKDVKLTLVNQHYLAHKDELLSLARRRIGDFWKEDVVQEAYERCYRYIDQIPISEKELTLYVYTVMANVIRDYQRNTFSQQEVTEEMWVSGDLAQDMRSKGVLKEVLTYLDTYPLEQRNIIYAYVIQGDDARVVSQKFGVSLENVWKISSRFRAAARGQYELY